MDLNNIKYNHDDNERNFITSIIEHQFIFEVTKCCGFVEWISVFKQQPLSSLYSNIGFQHNNIISNLYTVCLNTNQKLIIPNADNITIKEYLLNNSDFFKPIYPLPLRLVYKIYYTEDNCHLYTHNNNQDIYCNICNVTSSGNIST